MLSLHLSPYLALYGSQSVILGLLFLCSLLRPLRARARVRECSPYAFPFGACGISSLLYLSGSLLFLACLVFC